ncbi:hypothetical protein ACFV0R_21315 [Streptomyces sp. NPDC059578]|uniref:hypothetical protein n=1 Tax=Streptomyces sp. NPDC059578 TaxID=3346874 RepID=UPI003697B650
MHARRFLASAGVAAATVALTAPLALAAGVPAGGAPGPRPGSDTLSFSPDPVRAGHTTTVRTFSCGNSDTATVNAESLGVRHVRLTRDGRDGRDGQGGQDGRDLRDDQDARGGPQSGARDELSGRLDVPWNTRPGRYDVHGTCDNGAHLAGVLEVVPSSGSHAGFGGSRADEHGTLTTAAGGVLIVGAVAGGAFLHRARRRAV